ncbi:MAG: DUF362 domain-containing protein, partial [Candidatus Omnitrophica bacterium]|nr:DUF362 domain-containing protein [Candidatus Omnitrophota bacterium]
MKELYPYFTAVLDKKVSRKKFLKIVFSSLALLVLSGSSSRTVQASPAQSTGRPKKSIKTDHDLVIASGDDPYRMTVKAVEAIGGIEKFVKKGDVVLVKPNMGWDRTPEQAGNTNPQVVAALIDLSFKAGAKRVNVFDMTCNDARRCYANSGIEKVAKAHGATVYYPEDWDTLKASFAHKSPMEGWPILKDGVDCDVLINVPILKHHGLTRLTLSMKNLMGVCGGNRGVIHQNIGQKLVDLTGFMNPELTVIDAYRVLVRNGPTGGNLADVETMKKIIVAADPTLADIVACGIAGVETSDV